MKRIYTLLLLLGYSQLLLSQKDFTKLVNPFIGTGGHGHTYPGASMPFGMMQLSPDTRMADWDGSSGYHYSDTLIYGFSHTHLSGTGIPDYCDLLFMPFTGETKWERSEYRSTFSHKNEKASPGLYEVLLDKHKIKAQLSTTTRAGMHQYIFPSAGQGKLLIDLEHRDQLLDVHIEKVSNNEIRGFRRSRSWAQDQTLFFYIRSEQPFYSEEKIDTVNGKITTTKMVLSLLVPADKMVRFKVGISGVSMDGAKANLDTEIPHWDFAKILQEAKTSWNRELGKIEIKGGTRDQQTAFYTALYHTFLVPNIYQDVDGQYRGTDLKVHRADGFTNYTVFSLWDTYRAYHPLMTILNTKRTTDWIQTFLRQYEHGGMLPVWEFSGNETFCMIGYHSVPVIVDAWQKGIRGFDGKLALKATRSYAESNRFGLDQYREQGYISNDREHESVSKTLEYAYDDWCIAQFAKALGDEPVYKQYIRRAQYYKNVFDPATKHMRGKVQGMWHRPFDPREINNFYTEGNSWQYSFAVPQDIETLVTLHGGRDAFAKKLAELFTTSSQTTGRDQADVTGLIGQYAHGNEPSHHMAYLFNYVGMPWKTQELVHRICTEFYTNAPDGLIGNEDCGQMSAWYLFSTMGFYPVNPANGEYILGTPLFNEVRIRLENGKNFVIRANRKSPGDKYVASVKLNGNNQSRSYITHADVANGGSLEFILDKSKNTRWGTAKADLPRSVIAEEMIVPVPFFDASSNKFRDSLRVGLQHIDPDVQILFSGPIERDDIEAGKNNNSFRLKRSSEVTAFAAKGGETSAQVKQSFHQLPTDISVQVLSKVHPMYTAGGPEALIDGIRGTGNWRNGEWQSYFDQDFEAIIDLQKTRPVSYVGVHVLQDISPWIVYPKELVIYASADGKNYMEVARQSNVKDLSMGPVETMDFGKDVKLETRYLKIRAASGGKLPSWHESAGNPSHLFIDEIIVK